jgi:chaperonin cofactor prefoldin
MQEYERTPPERDQELVEAIEKLRKSVEALTEEVGRLEHRMKALVQELQNKR